MTQRTIDDVPRHLTDKYKPRLKDIYNKAAKLEEKMSNMDADDVSMFDMIKAMNIARKFIKVATDFQKAGGSDEDFELIDAQVQKEIAAQPKP